MVYLFDLVPQHKQKTASIETPPQSDPMLFSTFYNDSDNLRCATKAKARPNASRSTRAYCLLHYAVALQSEEEVHFGMHDRLHRRLELKGLWSILIPMPGE